MMRLNLRTHQLSQLKTKTKTASAVSMSYITFGHLKLTDKIFSFSLLVSGSFFVRNGMIDVRLLMASSILPTDSNVVRSAGTKTLP